MTDRSGFMGARRGRAPSHIPLVALAMALGISGAHAQGAFVTPDPDFEGQIRASAVEGAAIYPGGEVEVSGRGFKPGQEITLERNDTELNSSGPFVADGEGTFAGTFTLPEDAAIGVHPIIAEVQNPSFATVFDLKISPEVPLSGTEKFEVVSKKLARGLYQVAYSAKEDALFVTSSVGRPPVKDSAILKVDPETLEIVARGTASAAPSRPDGREGGVFAVYGIGVDDTNGNVWVTNTRQDTVAVYRQSDLSLVKQFEPGAVEHARDVVVDPKSGKAYVSALGTPNVAVFDAKTLELRDQIEITSTKRGDDFSPASLDLDPESGTLFAVSLSTAEIAVIDTGSNEVSKVIPVPLAKSAIGVGYDPASNRVFVAAQGSDNVLIVDGETGETLHNVATGAGPLNVAVEPESQLAFVSNRGAGTIAVLDTEGEIVANLENGTLPNHVTVDGKGNVFAVNKSRGEDDPEGDQITRITPASD